MQILQKVLQVFVDDVKLDPQASQVKSNPLLGLTPPISKQQDAQLNKPDSLQKQYLVQKLLIWVIARQLLGSCYSGIFS